MDRVYEGGCHCGKLRFRVTTDLTQVLDCNCSICTKKGFLHLIMPPGAFELLSGANDITIYQFNTGTARHSFCRHCGVQPFYVPRSDPDKIDVNLRCIDDVDLTAFRVVPFDGRVWEAALRDRDAAG